MTKRPRQDDSAENIQINIFGLIAGPGRSNKYVPDGYVKAGGRVFSIELKSTSESRGSFSTSSRMGMMKIEAWKGEGGFDYAIFSLIDKNGNFVEHVICSHKDLQPFYDKVSQKQLNGHAGRAGMSSWYRARKNLETLDWSKKELDALEKQNKFGSRMNDPGISWKEVREWGTKIDKNNPAKHLKEFLEEK
tara:strand:+ start:1283 stop:1855 length:573 start_codon:yes stop_codon:yes gene_type:complete